MSEDEARATSIPGLVHGQLCYLQLPSADIAGSARFYERVFGWSIDPPESGFDAPGLIGQWVTDRPPAPDAGLLAWVWVDDINGTLDEVIAAEGEIREPPTPDGPRWLATFIDPSGNLIGIAQHGEPRPGPSA